VRGPKPPFDSARLRRVCPDVLPFGGRSLLAAGHLVTGWGAHAYRSRRASPRRRPKPATWRSPTRRFRSSRTVRIEAPSRVLLAEAGCPLEGTLGLQARRRLAEARWRVSRSLESCLALALHRSGSRMQDTQCGNSTTPPMGFGPLRRLQSGRSLCRFASSTPSALRVSHPLSGLIPPGVVALFHATSALGVW
jgi:hypothetical protein